MQSSITDLYCWDLETNQWQRPLYEGCKKKLRSKISVFSRESVKLFSFFVSKLNDSPQIPNFVLGSLNVRAHCAAVLHDKIVVFGGLRGTSKSAESKEKKGTLMLEYLINLDTNPQA